MIMYGDDMQAIASFLIGLQKLCEESGVAVAGDADGIAVYHEGDILGHVGMHDTDAYAFKPLETNS